MKTLFASILFALPLFVSAQVTAGNVLSVAVGLIDMAIPLVITLSLFGFFWGLIKYITSAGDGEGRDKGKHTMIGGIIGLLSMIIVWNIVGFLSRLFN